MATAIGPMIIAIGNGKGGKRREVPIRRELLSDQDLLTPAAPPWM
jgi:hypothetical protein